MACWVDDDQSLGKIYTDESHKHLQYFHANSAYCIK